MTRNAKGRENDPELLGKDFNSVLDAASLQVYDTLTTAVNQALQNEYLHRAKREELLASLEQQLAEVKAARKNPLDKIYKAHVQQSITRKPFCRPSSKARGVLWDRSQPGYGWRSCRRVRWSVARIAQRHRRSRSRQRRIVGVITRKGSVVDYMQVLCGTVLVSVFLRAERG